MAASLMNLVQWSTTSYSTHEFLDNYEPRFPTLALVRSIGAPPKATHNLTNTEVSILLKRLLGLECSSCA